MRNPQIRSTKMAKLSFKPVALGIVAAALGLGAAAELTAGGCCGCGCRYCCQDCKPCPPPPCPERKCPPKPCPPKCKCKKCCPPCGCGCNRCGCNG